MPSQLPLQHVADPCVTGPALTVTLAYDVFVPASFEYVQGGKLPGLYGGREECSGGDEAADCWSARFMWRTDVSASASLHRELI